MSGVPPRPAAAYVVGLDGPAALVPYWAADWIFRKTNIEQVRTSERGTDPNVDAVLVALRAVAMMTLPAVPAATAARGRTPLPLAAEPAQSVHGQLSTADVAERLGCKPRNVRDLHERGRLSGERLGGRLLFDPADVTRLLAERKERLL